MMCIDVGIIRFLGVLYRWSSLPRPLISSTYSLQVIGVLGYTHPHSSIAPKDCKYLELDLFLEKKKKGKICIQLFG